MAVQMSDGANSLVSTSGFALRTNGSCLDTETDCGVTVAPFRACCPAGSFCPSQYNVNCCPSAANCTESLLANPTCANETWNLYDNGGYFCCLPGTTGYATPEGSDGCALPGYTFNNNETLLGIVSSGRAAPTSTSSIASSISSTSLPATTTTQSPGPVTSPASVETAAPSKANAGAIGGGVVGGVVGAAIIVALLWFFLRRQKTRNASSYVDEGAVSGSEPAKPPDLPMADSQVVELEGQIPELESQPVRPVYELSSDPMTTRAVKQR
ncbi:hypothetical protein VTN77DRAFT_6755 [Rasamsonia byssochlamydoides]|uniref:uncharacterized protein n=1 Tax=Rasamsonia byssochlamydoides TaxID=89139 RepID=UPI0037442032